MSGQSLPAPQVEPKQKFTAKVIKTTLAGAIVDIGQDSPGVIHISQLSSEPVKRVEDVVQIGQELDVWVRRVDRRTGRIEMTTIEPLPLEWREIKEGIVVKGTVERLEKFGAFIDIGSERPGLAHVSELSHEYVRDPKDVLKVGDDVEAKVIGVNRRRRQIKLSLKALKQEPEPEIEEPEEEEAIPTAMEVALRKAMTETENGSEAQSEEEQPKPDSTRSEAEDILSRTLENRMRAK